MNDDDLTSHFIIQSSQQVCSSHCGVAKFVGIQLGGMAVQATEANPISRSEGRAGSPPDKFGDEVGDQSGGLIESCINLKFSIRVRAMPLV